MNPKLALMLTLTLLVGTLSVAFNVQRAKASGTIYIRADGSIDPPTASISTIDNVTYALTDNVASDTGGIVVERDNIVVDGAGYTLQAIGSGDGIDITGRSNVTIKNMTIKACYQGIYLSSSSGCSISGNNITENNDCGILCLSFSSNNSISGNNITNNEYGITLSTSSNCNSISGNNIATNRGGGILLSSSSNYNSISGNNITNNSYGIYLQFSSSNNTISDNSITANNNGGIWLDSSSNNTVSSNSISNNEYGIYIRFSDSSNTKIFHNSLVNNNIQVFSEPGSANTWDDGCEGNYWSNYNGTDSDADGVGDTPYVVDSYNVDNCPLMNPYWIPADVNHDLIVNIFDVVKITGTYGATPASPYWNPHADIAEPFGKIDIFDVVLCTSHYGQKYP